MVITAIVIFVLIFAVQTYYNMQDLKYYQDRVTETQQRLDEFTTGQFILPFAYGYGFVSCPDDNPNFNYTYPEGTDCDDIEKNMEKYNIEADKEHD